MDIILQKFKANDFEDYFRLVSDIRVMAMITERSIPVAEARHDYAALLLNNDLERELGHFRILGSQPRQFMGLAKLAIADKSEQTAELGYMLLPEYWGQGIGSQVTKILIERALQQHLQSLFAIIDPANVPSRKILIKHGFISRELKDFDGLPGEILERGL